MRVRSFLWVLVVAAVAVSVAPVPAVANPVSKPDGGCGVAASPLGPLGVAACPAGDVVEPEVDGLGAPAAPIDRGPCAPSVMLDKCEAWVSEFYNGPGNGPDSVGDQNLHGPIVGTSSDGKVVYTAGHSDADPTTASDRDIAVLAIDAASGARLWTARYEGDAGHRDAMPLGLSVSEAGIFVTAILSNGTTDWFSRILAFDTEGNLRWDRALSWMSYAIDATSDGRRVVITGAEVVETPERVRVDAVTRAFDATTGATIWERRLIGDEELGIVGFRLAVSGDDSRVVVAASRYRLEEPHLGMTVRLEVATYDLAPTGNPQDEGTLVSAAEYPTFGYLLAGLAVNHDGTRAYVAQSIAHGPENWQQTLAIGVNTEDGRVLWARRYAGPRPGMSVVFPWYYGPIALSGDESIVYVGSFISTAMNNAGNGFAVEALDATFGERVWTQEHPGNVALCFGCGPTLTAVRDQVVVTTRAPEVVWAYQFMTVAYDQDHGARMWTRVFRDGRSGHSGGIVAAPDGKRVFVAASAGTYTATATDRSVDILIAAYDL